MRPYIVKICRIIEESRQRKLIGVPVEMQIRHRAAEDQTIASVRNHLDKRGIEATEDFLLGYLLAYEQIQIMAVEHQGTEDASVMVGVLGVMQPVVNDLRQKVEERERGEDGRDEGAAAPGAGDSRSSDPGEGSRAGIVRDLRAAPSVAELGIDRGRGSGEGEGDDPPRAAE